MGTMRRCVVAVLVMLLLGGSTWGEEPRREIRFPDVPGYRTLKCDLHIHTVFSDGDVWPTTRVKEAWAEGMDAISITDHYEVRPHKGDVPMKDFNRPYEIARELAAARNILLVRGGEITLDTPPGHFNLLFVEDLNPLEKGDLYARCAAAAEQKAFIMWNHPSWLGKDRGRWGEAQDRLFEAGHMHAVEICNGDEYYDDGHRHALERKLPMLGSSDMHPPSPYATRTPERHRTMTLVFAKEKTLGSLREALDAGRTAVWFNNSVIGREEMLAPLFDACVKVHPAHRRTKDGVLVEIENRSELDIKLESVSGSHKLTLPSGVTTLAELKPSATQPAGVQYRATNFLVAPGRGLEVRLGTR